MADPLQNRSGGLDPLYWNHLDQSETGSQPDEPPSTHSVLTSRIASIADLQVKLIEHKTQSEFTKNSSGWITESIAKVFLDWVLIPTASTSGPYLFSQLAIMDSCSMIERVNENTARELLKNLFSHYRALSKLYKNGKPKKRTAADFHAMKNYAIECWHLTRLFNFYCQYHKDMFQTFSPEELSGIREFRERQRREMAENGRIFKEFIITLFDVWKKEGKKELEQPYGLIELDEQLIMGFVKENGGFIPVPFARNSNGIEKQVPCFLDHLSEGYQRVYLLDRGGWITDPGFLVEAKRGSHYVTQGVKITSMGYLGFHPQHPFQTIVESITTSSSSTHVGQQHLLTVFTDEIKAFAQSNRTHEIFFIPLIKEERPEGRVFEYLFLLDLLQQSQDVPKPLEQLQAAALIKQVELIEGKPFGDLIVEVEDEIKAELCQRYNEEFARQQEERKQQGIDVAKGYSPARRPNGPKGKNKVHSSKSADTNQARMKWVEEQFQQIKVTQSLKFKKLLKAAFELIKKCPETFKSENVAGSHLVLGFETGNATVVKTHGAKGLEISAKRSNQFLKKILELIYDPIKST